MIREVGASIGRAVLGGVGRAASRFQERRSLSADLLESDDAYLAVFDAPGATAADVDVRFERGAVSVRIDRFREFHDDYEMVLPGRGLALDGGVELPEGAAVDPDRAEATLTESGTLEVLIPKAADESTEDGDDGGETAVVDTSAEPDSGTGSETDSGVEPGVKEGTDPDTPGDGPNTT
ncbi:Hsp20/alpha crystallin family protein [Natronomonas sp. F2-12]|jgi:HSP20 family molecular chaperone IbpA|uniref:Hsp20/alpha crystallin family protein n=1 Tax=Natronomonas aquatica TaxID=2841590 RepID=A0A9R1CRM4_9EURY|nr:Hsp20/alpha crystallin family protein [Natronomonas aquatica]MCQ4332577.1 Hsp20/alpha crystallin family protein [Natronomonas aquatica]